MDRGIGTADLSIQTVLGFMLAKERAFFGAFTLPHPIIGTGGLALVACLSRRVSFGAQAAMRLLYAMALTLVLAWVWAWFLSPLSWESTACCSPRSQCLRGSNLLHRNQGHCFEAAKKGWSPARICLNSASDTHFSYSFRPLEACSMGRKAEEMVRVNIQDVLKDLGTIYCDEWLAHYQYWVAAC